MQLQLKEIGRIVMTIKKLYKGTFNYQREVVEEWTWAISEREAWSRITARIAAAVDASTYTIRQYFDGTKDNYKIEEVKT